MAATKSVAVDASASGGSAAVEEPSDEPTAEPSAERAQFMEWLQSWASAEGLRPFRTELCVYYTDDRGEAVAAGQVATLRPRTDVVERGRYLPHFLLSTFHL